MTLREHTVAIIQKNNLTPVSDKAACLAAYMELSNVTGITRAYARNRILEALDRIAHGLDPIQVERRANHGRAGRKPKKIILDDLLKDEIATYVHSVPEDKLLEALSTLPERERKILMLRLELHNGKSHTLQEIGDEMQVTRERVRQIQNRGIKYLIAALQQTS
jgi:RNA polymerase sigma factor (sigma-70 family)